MHTLRTARAAAAFVLLGLPLPVAAHGIWLADATRGYVLVYGHGADVDPYDVGKVTSMQGCDGAGACTPLESVAAADHVTLPDPGTAPRLAATFDNGFWSQDAEGDWHNLPKTEVEGAVRGGRYLKYTTYLAGHMEVIAPVGHALEIIPLSDPLDLAAGEVLAVQVLLHGAPLAGAEVLADYLGGVHEAPAVTDAEGIARVAIRNQGLNVLAVSAEEPSPDPALADVVGHHATLAFALHFGEE